VTGPDFIPSILPLDDAFTYRPPTLQERLVTKARRLRAVMAEPKSPEAYRKARLKLRKVMAQINGHIEDEKAKLASGPRNPAGTKRLRRYFKAATGLRAAGSDARNWWAERHGPKSIFHGNKAV